jgi:hypothetical protein
MMKSTKSNKKLQLNKEALRTLQSKDLGLVAGGMKNPTRSCNDSCGCGGGGGGGGGEDTFYGCWDSYLACYF